MNNMKKTVLKEYAKLLVNCGLSIKKGDYISMVVDAFDSRTLLQKRTHTCRRQVWVLFN